MDDADADVGELGGNNGADNGDAGAVNDELWIDNFTLLDAGVMEQLRRGDPDADQNLEVLFGDDSSHPDGPQIDAVSVFDWKSEGKVIAESTRVKALCFGGYGGSLSWPASDERNWANFEQFLRAVSRNRSIEHLFMGSNLENGKEGLLALLSPFFEHNTQLRSFSMGDDDPDSDWGHDLDTENLTVLASVVAKSRTIKKIKLQRKSSARTIKSSAWVALSKCLTSLSSSLEVLDLESNGIDGDGANAVAQSLPTLTELKSLSLTGATIYPDTTGWRGFFGGLPNLRSLQALELECSNFVDDEAVGSMEAALANAPPSLKELGLSTILARERWESIANALSRSRLEELWISADFQIDNDQRDDVVAAFASALARNTSLKELRITLFEHDGEDLVNILFFITDEGCAALANLLCNKTSIETIHGSNHTLEKCKSLSEEHLQNNDCLAACLQLNGNANKAEVARRKIISFHFSDGEDNIQDLHDFQLTMMPHALAWMGRDDADLSLMYRFVQSAPSLFQLKGKSNVGWKRKRGSGGEEGVFD